MSDSQIEALRADFERDLTGATTLPALRAVRDRYLARKGGLVSALLKSLGLRPPMSGPALESSRTTSVSTSNRSLKTGSRPRVWISVPPARSI